MAHDNYTRTEITVGVFVLAGIAALAYLSVFVGGLEPWPPPRYRVQARFASIGDLKRGAPVKLAGVRVGKVGDIGVADYAAQVDLELDETLKLPSDTIASIRTAGLLGEAYVSLSPGASDRDLAQGDRVSQTESAFDFVEVLGKYAFGDVDGDHGSKDRDRDQGASPGDAPIADPLE